MSISRAQLAAALVEYDNEDAAPSERKNHRQSALFSFLQPRSPPPPQLPSLSSHASLRDGHAANSHQSRPSTSGKDWEHHDAPVRETEQPARPLPVAEEDIDVSRWGLPEHLISTAAAKSPDIIRPMMVSRSSMNSIPTKSASTPVPNPESSPFQHRARSIHLDYPENPDNTSRPSMDSRRRASSIDIGRDLNTGRRRTVSNSAQMSGADAALAAAQRAIALAEAPRARSVMGVLDDGVTESGPSGWVREPMMIPLPSSPTSIYDRPKLAMSQGRSIEMDRRKSFMGEMYDDGPEYKDEEKLTTPNPFALPAPPSSQASRFDPKFSQSATSPPLPLAHEHRTSFQSPQSHPSPSRVSSTPRTNPTSPPLPLLNDPSRPIYPDIPTPDEYGKPLMAPKYARRQPHPNRQSLLRPRTLIMPVSLQGMDYIPEAKVRDGFTLGEKPLPAGARSSIMSMGPGGQGGMWQGRQSGAGQDVPLQGREFGRGLAQELQAEEEEDRLRKLQEEERRAAAEARRRDKMPGKLYGTSLMDQLEARKQYTKNKQRAFTGDSRPTMFARQSLLPGSASSQSLSPNQQTSPQDRQRPLISPPGLQSQQFSPTSPDKTNRHSVRAPLIQFDGNGLNAGPGPGAAEGDGARPGAMPRSRSVFGVDELWEKEMAKLRIIQAEEEVRRVAREEKEREEAERESERKKKKGWLGGRDKGKGKAMERDAGSSPGKQQADQPLSPSRDGQGLGAVGEDGWKDDHVGGVSPIKNRVGDLPPTLRYSPEKASAPTALPDVAVGRRPASRAGLDGWASQDEEDGPPQRKDKGKGKAKAVAVPLRTDSDSEDDVPLSRIILPTSRSISNARAPPQPRPQPDSDSDEDVPLSRLAPRNTSSQLVKDPPAKLNSDVQGSLGLSVPALPPSVSPRPPTITPDFVSPALPTQIGDEDEDDDRPLGLRAGISTKSNLYALAAGAPGERTDAEKAEIEDDLPLGFKHAGAAQRQVSGGSGMPGMTMPQGYGGWGGMPPAQTFSPYHPQQSGWGVPQMQMGGMGSVYGMMGAGYHQQAYPAPVYAGALGGQHISGIPNNLPISTSGLPFLPTPQHLGMAPSGLGPAAAATQGVMGLGAPPGPGPGQNIDSWRKGVRAPSTVGTGGG